MNQGLLQIQMHLLLNNVFDGDDVFAHGFHLPKDVSIEEFSNQLFSEGIRKGKTNSILSTIALMPHNKPLEESLANYVARGNYRAIVKIPEEVGGIFLGKCKHAYGDAGNQYSINSVLDLIPMSAIPPEFIVGILYTEKELYDPNEVIQYEFIHNPNYFDHDDFKERNTQSLKDRLTTLINQENSRLLNVITDTQDHSDIDHYIDLINKYNMSDKYVPFLEQRKEYNQAQANHNSIQRPSCDMVK